MIIKYRLTDIPSCPTGYIVTVLPKPYSLNLTSFSVLYANALNITILMLTVDNIVCRWQVYIKAN